MVGSQAAQISDQIGNDHVAKGRRRDMSTGAGRPEPATNESEVDGRLGGVDRVANYTFGSKGRRSCAVGE